jgi:hypothetical protein
MPGIRMPDYKEGGADGHRDALTTEGGWDDGHKNALATGSQQVFVRLSN